MGSVTNSVHGFSSPLLAFYFFYKDEGELRWNFLAAKGVLSFLGQGVNWGGGEQEPNLLWAETSTYKATAGNKEKQKVSSRTCESTACQKTTGQTQRQVTGNNMSQPSEGATELVATQKPVLNETKPGRRKLPWTRWVGEDCFITNSLFFILFFPFTEHFKYCSLWPNKSRFLSDNSLSLFSLVKSL